MARFVIIDDDEDLRSVVQMILTLDGHDAEVAANADKALDMQRARPADVIITDIFMPDKDGLETIHQFRQEFPQVRIIAMSGGGEVVKTLRYLASARQLGAVQVIQKPFDGEALLAVVREVLAMEP
jgi:DNA-binding NtrC family response regulator